MQATSAAAKSHFQGIMAGSLARRVNLAAMLPDDSEGVGACVHEFLELFRKYRTPR